MNILRNNFSAIGIGASLLLLVASGPRFAAQDESSRLHVNVVLVQLNVAVTDHKGNYIQGLKPEDFEITEDKIPERIATFEEGSAAARSVADPWPSRRMRERTPATRQSQLRRPLLRARA